MNKIILISITMLSIASSAFGKQNIGNPQKRESGLHKTAAGCDQTTAVIDLDVNNVRARLMTGGDMWWDRPNSTAAYEVPKNSNKNALFAGSLWIGGVDKSSGKIKVAAQTYRQTGNDYWTGPLDDNGSIDYNTCAEWDRFWKINTSDINKFRLIYSDLPITDTNGIKNRILDNEASVPLIIKEWPAKGNKDVLSAGGGLMSFMPNRDMAGFVDVDTANGGKGVYNWRKGDYPKILGDQYIWWIFNDKGNTKTETSSDAIGLEIQSAAFAFSTNNCLNDATFYNYKINNFSTSQLDSTYMSTWSDADLGYAFDDYVGCDTARGLGILYNGDKFDDGAQGYGFEIPMVGIDYFRGPKYFDVITQKDTVLKMSNFTYYDNDFTVYGNPEALSHFYGYMTGSWKNGARFTRSDQARAAVSAANPITNFIFTGDPCKKGTWSEVNTITGGPSNTPADRRFIHSAGPFPLIPGAVPSDITIGAIWVPNVGGGEDACFSKIQVCDDRAQNLFINEFNLPDGPQAPKMVVQPLDRKLVFDLDNLAGSNNENEQYPTNLNALELRKELIKKAALIGNPDSTYKFEGYIVYQLKNSTVSLSDVRNKDGSVNTEKAKAVFQCDVKNGIRNIINYEIDPEVSSTQYIPKLLVSGADKGISHSFQITEDAFASGTSKSLVNYKTYYYVAIAYAFNKFQAFDQNNLDSTQDIEYLESRTDGRKLPIQVIKAMPHPASDSLYIQTYADYGTGIQLKRIEGKGNGGIALDLSDESEMEALQGPNYQTYFPTYKPGSGPLKMKVVNPDSIKAGTYTVKLLVDSFYKFDPSTTATTLATGNDTSLGAKALYTKWLIARNGPNGEKDTIFSGSNILNYNEKYLRRYFSQDALTGNTINSLDWGIMAAIQQQKRPGDNPKIPENGLISSSITFGDKSNTWLTGIQDGEGKSFFNWIRAGVEGGDASDASNNDCNTVDWDNKPITVNNSTVLELKNKDQAGTFEGVLNGTFAPYNLVSAEIKSVCGYGLMYGSVPATGGSLISNDRLVNRLEDIYSIDIVLTNDRSLWSKCPVIEMTDYNLAPASTVAENGAFKFNMRKHASLLKNPNSDGTPAYDNNDMGMSYFPGYAINLETGERLNIAFGEESFNSEDNGKDMIWNPTSRFAEFNGDVINRWGGKHIIYVTRTKYDEGLTLKNKIAAANNTALRNDANLREAYKSMMWVGVPMLTPGYKLKSFKDGIIPTETRIKISVTRPYAAYKPDPNKALENNGWPLYTFTTDGIVPVKLGDAGNSYTSKKDELLKRIHAVPNPYYAVSEYESNRLETKIKIINLPEKATIKIYTLDGALVKTINKNDGRTNYVDWDLKNNKNIPIVSGMYLIHVDLPGIGETVVKWFGAMRPVDITNF